MRLRYTFYAFNQISQFNDIGNKTYLIFFVLSC